MSEHSDSPQRRGGRARVRATTAVQRSEIAKAGAMARWAKANAVPQAEFGSPDTPLRVGEIELDCYVLNNSQRVISQRGLFRGLNVARGGPRDDMRADEGGAELPRFATQDWLLPFLSNDLLMALRKSDILFSAPSIARVYGYPATILTENLRRNSRSGRAAGKTTPRQDAIVQRAGGF